VTGVAGFIGSSIADRMLANGHEVAGIDCFTAYYPRAIKENNLASARQCGRFTLHEADLCDVFEKPDSARARELLEGVDVVFHQAAQAGVRASWGRDFEIYTHCNILATQKLLEACKSRSGLKIVYASSSSVYGETDKFPMSEEDLPAPVSPYGVSKLAAEHLARLYHANYGTHTVSLRYFTVYGPRQRPDMAFHRLITAVLKGEEFVVYGDGTQTRDFTFIDDIVGANIDAAERGRPGGVYNLGGGTRISMNDVFKMVEGITGKPARIRYIDRHHGDVSHTAASVARAERDFGFKPQVSLPEGLRREAEWIEQVMMPLASTSTAG
jgi:nucleoside-diphosphate-sugar epimerase